jgi:hypothetical protein
MKTETVTLLLQIAGVLHLGLMAAGLSMPRVVNMRVHLAKLPPFLQRLFWVYYTFIAFCLVSFGLVSFFFAGTLAAGTGLARAVCAFMAIFWTIRLIAALFVFDVRPYLTNAYWKLGYAATNLVFACFPIIYAIAAWKRN